MTVVWIGAAFVASCLAAHAWDVLIVRPREWAEPLPGWDEQDPLALEARLHPDYKREVQAEREVRLARMTPQPAPKPAGQRREFPRRVVNG